MEAEYVGFDGQESEGHKNYLKLKSIANKEELIDLTKHDHPDSAP